MGADLFLLGVLALIFFYLFKIDKNKSGSLKLTPRNFGSQTGKSVQNLKKQIKTFFSRQSLLRISTAIFIVLEIIVFINLIDPLETLIKVRASQLIPDKFAPIARFAANMDWDNNTIKLDASMSKAYEDKVTNYIWRIDDGTSLVGSSSLTHQFKHPGYYYIQMSVVDADNQSDSATCRVLIPPKKLDKIPSSEQVSNSNQVGNESETVQKVEYEWVPVGGFFNYSKMGYRDRSYANLTSRYIDSNCGYSNRGYNTSHSSYVDFFHNVSVQKALAQMLRIMMTGLLVIPTAYFGVRKLITRVK